MFYPKRVFAARQIAGKPLTFSEKVLLYLPIGTDYYLTFLEMA
jgi:hypothetical protein